MNEPPSSRISESLPAGHEAVAIPALVDRVYSGIRLRHLPGAVNLIGQSSTAPAVEPGPSLSRTIAGCLTNEPLSLTVLKAVPAPDGRPRRRCPGCGAGMIASQLDCALGDNAGLVIERVAGHWCWQCWRAVVPNNGAELRSRLAGWKEADAAQIVPSIGYDTPEHPRSLQFELTTRCNLSCAYCSNRHLPTTADLEFDSFTAMLNRIEMTLVDNVDLTGLGEPLLQPRLPDMVREIRRRADPTNIRVVSNGVALSLERATALIDAGLTSIAVSVDTLDPERFARRRGAGCLAKILDNLAQLALLRQRQPAEGFRLKLKAVLIGEPEIDAEALMAWSARHGLDMPHFSALDGRDAAQGRYDQPWLESDWAGARAAAFGAWAAQRWRELGGRPIHGEASPTLRPGVPPSPATQAAGFSHPSLLQAYDQTLCRWAIDACFVTSDSSLLSCCETMIDLPQRAFGRLANGSLRALWTGPLLWGYRLPLALGCLPPGCLGCAQAPLRGEPLIIPG